MSSASCLCGQVAWELDGPFIFMSHCHCSRCRKAHGAAFATYVATPTDRFRLRGEEHVGRFEPSGRSSARNFCTGCGSVVPAGPVQGLVFVPAGNFDDDCGERPVAHIFVASKAPWFEVEDGLTAFDEFPPGTEATVLPDRPPLDPPGKPRGSCLCGGVTYVVDGVPLRAMNCHCGRCRKARSAAHASNLFTTADGVRFTRGEDLLASYKVPDAQHFTHVFCRTCGSSMPRIDRGRSIAVVPMGGLDDDPGIRPQAHIFVASKAPWYEIPGNLPQHAEYPR
jgi:hypothetical protein